MKAAPQRGALATSLWLRRNGLWPVPIHSREKRPVARAWGKQYPSREDLIEVFEAFKGAGVGIALGPIAGIVDFEIDNPETAPSIELPPTLGWSSRRGQHKLFLWDKRLDGLPATVHIGGAELRIGGERKQTMSVCPPSVGTDRRCRRWNQCWEVCAFPECLLREIERPKPRREPTVIPQVSNRYAEAALSYEAKAVATAAEGTRNDALNRSAWNLSRFISIGLLTRASIEAVLGDAASVAGLGDREIASTLKSAIDARLSHPW